MSGGALAFELNFAQGMSQIIQWISDLLGTLFAVLLGTNDQLFERVLMLAIVLAITYVVLTRVPAFKNKDETPKKAIVWIIAIAVSLLAVRVTYNIDAVNSYFTRLSYTVLGVTITAVVPFIIYFFFVQSFDKSAVIRKTLWMAYGIIFIGVWIQRYDEVGPLSWVYFFIALLALIFFLADGTIRRIMVNQRLKELGDMRRADYERMIERQIKDLHKDRADGIIDEAHYQKSLGNLKSQLKTVRKN